MYFFINEFVGFWLREALLPKCRKCRVSQAHVLLGCRTCYKLRQICFARTSWRNNWQSMLEKAS